MQQGQSNNSGQSQPKNALTRCLDAVERLGNLLPHPVLLFLLLSIAVVFISGIAGFFELSVTDPRPEGSKGRSSNGLIEVVSLFNLAGLHRILSSLVSNFTTHCTSIKKGKQI